MSRVTEVRSRPRTISAMSRGRPADPHPPPSPPRWAFVLGALVFVAATAIHVAVLYGPGTPAGIDTGNWLAFGRDLLGVDVKPDGVVYPPAVPLVAVGAVSAFGPAVGIALVGGLAAVAPAAAAYLVLRWAGLGVGAVAIAATLLFAPGLGEIAAWGGYPQLFAAPVAVTFLWSLDRWISTSERTPLLVAVAAAVLLLATSHFAALVTTASAVILMLLRTASAPSGGRGGVLRRAGVGAGLTLLAASPLILVYSRLVSAVLATQGGPRAVPTARLASLPSRFADIHGGSAAFLLLGLAAGVVAIVITRPSARDALWTVNAALLVGVASTFLWTREPRVLYDVPLVAAVGAGTLLREAVRRERRPRLTRAAAAALVGVAFVVTTVSGVGILDRQRRDYAVASAEISAGLSWVRDATPESSRIAAATLDSTPLGWWIEGLGERVAIATAPPEWLVYPEERLAAADARRLFGVLERDLSAGLGEARRLGIDYLFIPKETPEYELLLVDILHGRLEPVFQNEAVAIFDMSEAQGSR